MLRSSSGDARPMDEKEGLPQLVLPIEARDNCRGPTSAPYSVVEYGDYTSRRCRTVAGALSELVQELRDDLCFAYRNFPDPKPGSRSRAIAEAAEAAGLQGKFWLMHDRIFAHQDDLSDPVLREIARGLPIAMEDFERDLARGEAARRVDEDLESATEAGVGDTPTIFVNGTLYAGQYEFLPLLKAVQSAAPAAPGPR